VLKEDNLWENRRKLITVCSMAASQILQVYGAKALPVLESSHPLAGLYIKKVHRKGHEGVVTTLHRSRKEVWIIGG
jgi:hypothetical protein